MNIHTRLLVQVLDELGIKYEFADKTKNLVRVGDAPYRYFHNHQMPLNRSDVKDICRDKDHLNQILSSVMRIPDSYGYLDPFVTEMDYREYLKYDSIEKILDDIEEKFGFPVIIKKNQGYLGISVFKCQTRGEAKNALEKIYDRESRDFDYVALVQKYIEPKAEYRVCVLDGEIQFVYKKDNGGAIFEGNLSPLHWANSKARLIENQDFVERIRDYIKPIFQEIDLVYGGIDIIEDNDGELWLIEINNHPGYGYFIRDNGPDKVVDLYRKVLKKMNF